MDLTLNEDNLVGEGSNSKVYKWGNNVVKVFNNKNAFKNESDVYSLFSEEKNEYILPLLKNIKSQSRTSNTMIFPYVPYNLEEFIIGNYDKKIRNVDTCKIIVNILCGLNSIHSKGIYHRDFKAKNILMDDNCNIKIIDFDLTRINLSNDEFEKAKKDDLRLARIIIFQLIWGKKYHDVCYSIKKSWEQVKNELPNLYELFNVRNYNLEDLVLYFSDMNNILKIWKKTMN
jgi:serine/threonine protein kinase